MGNTPDLSMPKTHHGQGAPKGAGSRCWRKNNPPRPSLRTQCKEKPLKTIAKLLRKVTTSKPCKGLSEKNRVPMAMGTGFFLFGRPKVTIEVCGGVLLTPESRLSADFWRKISPKWRRAVLSRVLRGGRSSLAGDFSREITRNPPSGRDPAGRILTSGSNGRLQRAKNPAKMAP